MSGADILVLSIIVSILSLAVLKLHRSRKKGGASCPGCAGCPIEKACSSAETPGTGGHQQV